MVSSIIISTSPNLPPSSYVRRQSPPASSSSRARFLIPRAQFAFPGGGVEIEDVSLIRRPTVFDATSPLRNPVSNNHRPNGGGFGLEETMPFWSKKVRLDPEYIDLEDEILEETVPIVGFVRMLLHSGTYGSGDRLTPEHEKIVMERLLPHHPEYESKVGSGVDFITIGFHPDYESSRCLFIVRRDRELVDFSYWKCVENLIRKKHPLYVDTFIQRHFRGGNHSISPPFDH